MDSTRQELLKKLLEHGEQHDAKEPDRMLRYRNITHGTGNFLAVLMFATDAKRVLEIGTSNGYSTIWLADAASQIGGHVTTIEADEGRAGEAAANFDRARVSDHVTLKRGQAVDIVATLEPASFDFIFLDAERTEYVDLWSNLSELLKPLRGVLVVDNAISHEHELVDFVGILDADPRIETSLVPVGKGELIAVYPER